MAAYRFSAQVIGRSCGRSSTAAAAYRAGISITDERTGLTHDYSRRQGVDHTEILKPDHAPEWMLDRSKLWNTVEHGERRKDSQLARELQLNLPHELDAEARRALVREFVQKEFVSHGMIADLAIHAPDEQGDERNHHAHVMLTMRQVVDGDFSTKKARQWNNKSLIPLWRERWADAQNLALEKAGLDVRVDHRSLEEQEIDREPEPKLGAVATQMERRGRTSHAGDDLREVWQRNAEKALLSDKADRLDLEITHARMQEERERSFDALYVAQNSKLEQQALEYQQQIDVLSSQLEGRSHFAVLWDKLRGRLGWRAEQELQAARIEAEEARERKRALELSYQQQQQRQHEQHEIEKERDEDSSFEEEKAAELADRFKHAREERRIRDREIE